MEIIRKRQRINTDTCEYMENPVGKCFCGEEVELTGFTNTCGCGRDYNQSGQELGPREHWGEETGESLADILRIK